MCLTFEHFINGILAFDNDNMLHGGLSLPMSCAEKVALSILWQYDTSKCIDASPLLVTKSVDGQSVVYIGSHSHHMVALEADTGNALWDIMLGDRIESSATVSNCGNCVIVGCYDGKVYFINSATGNINSSFTTRGQVKSSPCVDPITELVYIGSHDGHLYALSSQVQECLCVWKRDLGSGSVFASPCLNIKPYQLVVGTLGGHLAAVSPVNGELYWKHVVGKPLFSSPVPCLVGYIVGCVDNNVYAFSHSGQQIWQCATRGPVFSTPAVYRIPQFSPNVYNCDDADKLSANSGCQTEIPSSSSFEEIVVIGSHDRHVHCFSTVSGKPLWNTELDSEVYSTPCAFHRGKLPLDKVGKFPVDTVVVCSRKGLLYFIDVRTGQSEKLFSFPGETFSSAIIDDSQRRLFVGCRNNLVYCLNIACDPD